MPKDREKLIAEIKARKVRYSTQAITMLENMTDVDLEELENWVFNESAFGIIGAEHITHFIITNKKK